jgi:hypothetical protein
MSLATTVIDGKEFSYNPDTHLVETRGGMVSIRTARRQSGWVVSEIRRTGQGCYVASRATVLRPLYPREIRARNAKQQADKAASEAKAAEFNSFAPAVQDALTNAICLRKGKVRVPAEVFTKHTGLTYDGKSPYGPRLGKFLVKFGVAPQNLKQVIGRHVVGLKPW